MVSKMRSFPVIWPLPNVFSKSHIESDVKIDQTEFVFIHSLEDYSRIKFQIAEINDITKVLDLCDDDVKPDLGNKDGCVVRIKMYKIDKEEDENKSVDKVMIFPSRLSAREWIEKCMDTLN